MCFYELVVVGCDQYAFKVFLPHVLASHYDNVRFTNGPHDDASRIGLRDPHFECGRPDKIILQNQLATVKPSILDYADNGSGLGRVSGPPLIAVKGRAVCVPDFPPAHGYRVKMPEPFHETIISPPFGVTGRFVPVSIKAIRRPDAVLVADVYSSREAIAVPVTAVNVLSPASNVPLVKVFADSAVDLNTLAVADMSL